MKPNPLLVLALGAAVTSGCTSEPTSDPRIVAAGERFATAAPVVGFDEPPGYDGHQETCRFRDAILPTRPVAGCDVPQRYGKRRTQGLKSDIAAAITEQGYDLERLRARVDQVVVHFDVCGCSKRCFEVLHDLRGLSCHFLLDVDGTVYQTLDLEHRARHATIANDRSIGIEIAHIGAYPKEELFAEWYVTEPDGRRRGVFPANIKDPGVRTPNFVHRPARDGLFRGRINGTDLVQVDFTEEQYVALEQLLRSLREIFPLIEPRVPRDAHGAVPQDALDRPTFDAFRGVLGHYHVQKNKNDPGPAFDWDRIARSLQTP